MIPAQTFLMLVSSVSAYWPVTKHVHFENISKLSIKIDLSKRKEEKKKSWKKERKAEEIYISIYWNVQLKWKCHYVPSVTTTFGGAADIARGVATICGAASVAVAAAFSTSDTVILPPGPVPLIN